jgi:hypothetical protein
VQNEIGEAMLSLVPKCNGGSLDAEIAPLQHARSLSQDPVSEASRAPGELRTVRHFSPKEEKTLARDTQEDRGSSEEALGEAKGRQAGQSRSRSQRFPPGSNLKSECAR